MLTETRAMPSMVNPDKSSNFAIGVSPEHYWLITGLAHGNHTNRKAMLDEIIDHYIKCTFSKEAA